MSILSIRDLTVSFSTPSGDLDVLRGVSFDVPESAIVAIVGESGSGKSTLIRAVTGTLAPNARLQADDLTLHGRDLTSLSPAEYTRIRGSDIGFVPQDATLGLDPLVRVGRLAEEPLRKAGVGKQERRTRILELFEKVGLRNPERVYESYAHELSGGMCQRVLIAAAISTRPRLLIADEPTSALDVTIQKRILDLLVELRDEIDCSIVLVTHDLGIAEERADQVHVMSQGLIVESGPPQSILAAPTDEYTRLLLEASSVGRAAFARARIAEPARDDAPVAPPAVRVEHLSKSFSVRRKDPGTPALSDISFTAERGRTLGIVGESGSGKTTLLRIIAGLVDGYDGSVQFDVDGTPTDLRSGSARAYLRQRAQVIYQGTYASLDPRLRVDKILEEPLTGFGLGDRRARRQRIGELLDLVKLPQQVGGKYSSELSGGQRQRVAIARALAAGPDLLLADEPVSALDVTVQAQILDLFRDIQRDLGITLLFVSHDLSVISDIAHSTLVLLRGEIVDHGPSHQILQDTQIDYIRDLVEAIPGGAISAGALVHT